LKDKAKQVTNYAYLEKGRTDYYPDNAYAHVNPGIAWKTYSTNFPVKKHQIGARQPALNNKRPRKARSITYFTN
jgi:hypothetical protein